MFVPQYQVDNYRLHNLKDYGSTTQINISMKNHVLQLVSIMLELYPDFFALIVVLRQLK